MYRIDAMNENGDIIQSATVFSASACLEVVENFLRTSDAWAINITVI